MFEHQYALERYFNPSISKVVGAADLMRHQGYTTNGYWLIKSELEPDMIVKLRESDRKPDIDRLIKNFMSADLKDVTIENNLKVAAGTMLIELKNHVFNSWVNVQYMTFILKALKGENYTVHQTGSLSPVIFRDGKGQILALVMPVRH